MVIEGTDVCKNSRYYLLGFDFTFDWTHQLTPFMKRKISRLFVKKKRDRISR